MKKLIMLLLPALVIMSACEPIRDTREMGSILKPGDLKISVENVNPGSNAVVLTNKTPRVTGQWVYGDKIVGVGDAIPLILTALGEYEYTFIAMCDGGTVSATTVGVVTVMDVEVPSDIVVWTGNDGVDGGAQPKYPGSLFGDLEVGNTLRVEIENNGVGWGQVFYGDWSSQIMNLPGGFAPNFIEKEMTSDDVDKIKATGLVMQGAGFNIVAIIIKK